MILYFITPKKLDLELPWRMSPSKKDVYRKFVLWDTFKERLRRSRALLFQEGKTLTLIEYDKNGKNLEERFRLKTAKAKALHSTELSKRLAKFTGERFLFPSPVTVVETALTFKNGPKGKEFRSANSKAPFLYKFESDNLELLDTLSAKLLDSGFKKTELPFYLAKMRLSPLSVRALAEEQGAEFLLRLEKSIAALEEIAKDAADGDILKEIKRRGELFSRVKEEFPQEGALAAALPPLLKRLAVKALKGKGKAEKRLKLYLKYLLPLENLKALKKHGGWKKRLKALSGE